jgi:hypothetical protein
MGNISRFVKALAICSERQQSTFSSLEMAMDLRGSPSSVMRKTAYIASTRSDVNPPHCAHMGCWSSWISTLGASSDLESTPESWTVGIQFGAPTMR